MAIHQTLFDSEEIASMLVDEFEYSTAAACNTG
jgi:hypothetical protein